VRVTQAKKARWFRDGGSGESPAGVPSARLNTMNAEIPHLLDTLDARFNRTILLRCKELIEYDSPEHPFWHLNVFIGIAHETLKMQFHLKRAYKERELNYLAWAARNLLELRIWSMYVAKSEQNAWRFHQDQFIDGLTSVRSMEKAADKVGRAADAEFLRLNAAALRAKLKPLADNAGVTEANKYLSPKLVAKELDIAGEFDVHNTITSKLLHATGFSVLVAGDEVSTTSTMDSCFAYAASNGLSILDKLNAHMKSLCLPTFG